MGKDIADRYRHWKNGCGCEDHAQHQREAAKRIHERCCVENAASLPDGGDLLVKTEQQIVEEESCDGRLSVCPERRVIFNTLSEVLVQ